MSNDTQDILFISDLHLEKVRPEIVDIFTRFLRNDASNAQALYILGDLFEVWVGDDHPVDGLDEALQALQDLQDSVPVYFIHGNRDFLLGEQFAKAHHMQLIDEHTVIDLFGRKTLIMHGDTLCTDDLEYQQFRKQIRNPDMQAEFLQHPLEARLAQARGIREESTSRTAAKDKMITDVNQDEVVRVMEEHEVDLLIHGHTHRPDTHSLTVNDNAAERIVLSDWYEHGQVLRCNAAGITSEILQ